MHFVPIPTPKPDRPLKEQPLGALAPLWLPFIPAIADRSDETVDELIDLVVSGQIQIAVIWDEENKETRALLGLLYRRLGRELVCEVRWVTGFGAKDWRHLLSEVEKYAKEHVGCTIVKPICRPGWKPLLKKHGYKETHVVMEKML